MLASASFSSLFIVCPTLQKVPEYVVQWLGKLHDALESLVVLLNIKY